MYIFEDKKDDILSVLFRKAYPDEIAEDFVYAGGAGNIVKLVEKSLIDCPYDILYIFMDVVVDNPETVRIYKKLCSLSRAHSFRVIVFPLVCAEYYFIKSISGHLELFKVPVDLKTCVNKLFYRDSPLIENDEDKKFVTSFEKYCKLILKKDSYVLDCIRHSRGGNSTNLKYGLYYSRDCLCTLSEERCAVKTILHKSFELLAQYPCFPRGAFLEKKALSQDQLWMVHRILVEQYNDWCINLRNRDTPDRRYLYKTIFCIM